MHKRIRRRISIIILITILLATCAAKQYDKNNKEAITYVQTLNYYNAVF